MLLVLFFLIFILYFCFVVENVQQNWLNVIGVFIVIKNDYELSTLWWDKCIDNIIFISSIYNSTFTIQINFINLNSSSFFYCGFHFNIQFFSFLIHSFCVCKCVSFDVVFSNDLIILFIVYYIVCFAMK